MKNDNNRERAIAERQEQMAATDSQLGIMPTVLAIAAVGALLIGMLPIAALLGILSLALFGLAGGMSRSAAEIAVDSPDEQTRKVATTGMSAGGCLIGLLLIVVAFVAIISISMQYE